MTQSLVAVGVAVVVVAVVVAVVDLGFPIAQTPDVSTLLAMARSAQCTGTGRKTWEVYLRTHARAVVYRRG